MSDKPSFFFEQFVPGFDFLKNLATSSGAAGAAAKAGLPGMPGIPGLPGVSSWVAPTLSVEEVDKRIQELKAVQFWLDQNLHALKATIQALEVQRMTLSTLQGMNLQMEDLAKAFTGGAAASTAGAAAKAPPPRSEPEPAKEKEKPEAEAEEPTGKPAAASVIDPMQLWGALTQQFQQIATTALQEAAQLKMPSIAAPAKKQAAKAPAKAASEAKAPAAKKPPARKRSSTSRQR
ncbi:PhaM family polyhydroxyalkanoate granule multifunctional regulatory protein [Variovorax sp. OV329]|uniref:PhaM family polyhydroxyalkanoate granule multifunctional regulatory protein n=1 Tax=Variovorax sp. OV329 TaxID=1882825 RepID=UPI0008E288E7|nr:PhaM family polyhydroxyalkanoate granule multifunctional regulatory protein [Variovorax sp. OV329]SFM99028.1 hypothetical protein SAMN05444747_112146 [Variovorax sp. OV329]